MTLGRGVRRPDHKPRPIVGARAFTALTAPLITPVGTRIPGAAVRRPPCPRPAAGPARPPAALRGFTTASCAPSSRPSSASPRGHHRREDDLRPAPPPRTRAHRPHLAHPPLLGHRHRPARRTAIHPRPRRPPAMSRPASPPIPAPLRAAARATRPPTTASPASAPRRLTPPRHNPNPTCQTKLTQH